MQYTEPINYTVNWILHPDSFLQKTDSHSLLQWVWILRHVMPGSEVFGTTNDKSNVNFKILFMMIYDD